MQLATSASVTIGDCQVRPAKNYEFIGVVWGHRNHTVAAAKNTHTRLSQPCESSQIAVIDLEVLVPHMLSAAAVLGLELFSFAIFSKMARWRLSALNRGERLLGDPALLPPSAVGQGDALLAALRWSTSRVVPEVPPPPSVTLCTASRNGRAGWGVGAIVLLSSG